MKHEVLDLIDEALESYSQRNLISSEEVSNLLLDIRLLMEPYEKVKPKLFDQALFDQSV